MNKQEAEKIVAEKLELNKKECSIMSQNTEEFSKCFAVYYQGTKYVESGDHDYFLVGHGPVIVDKESGDVFETGSAYPTEKYVEAFEASGDPFTELSESILVTGWREGANTVNVIKFIHSKLNIGLAESKQYIDLVLDGKTIEINCKNTTLATEICNYLNKNEIVTKQLWK